MVRLQVDRIHSTSKESGLTSPSRFVLPLLGDYADSGHNSPKARLVYSLRSNLRYQLIILVCAAGALTYYVIQVGFSWVHLKGTVIALAYAWGLILAIYLMGHGLVSLPRCVFHRASVSSRLRQLHKQAPETHERMTEAIDELDELEMQVLKLRQRKTGTARDFQYWIEDLADSSDMPESRAYRGPAPSMRVAEVNVPAVVTERYLADLTRKLKRARHKRIRFFEEWDRLVQEATDCQSILDAARSQRLDFGRNPPSTLTTGKKSFGDSLSDITLLSPYVRYHLHANLLPTFRIALSALLAVASFSIILSEILKSLTRFSPISVTIIHHPSSTARGKIGFPGQMISGAWLCYMCACALFSIRDARVWGNRALVRRHTYAESACWYATQVAKLTVPLSYNFITFFPESIYKETAFYGFLGKSIDLTPLGRWFEVVFPMLILLPVAASLFGVYGKIKKALAYIGFAGGDEDGDDREENPYAAGGWREGRALIERERWGGGAAAADTAPGEDGEESVGLSSRTFARGDTSPYTDRSPRAASPLRQQHQPERQQPYSDHAPTTSSSAPRARAQRKPRSYEDDDEADDGNFFADFAHRVRNTLDNVDFDFKKPKWLGGDDEGASAGPARRGEPGGRGTSRAGDAGVGRAEGQGPLDRLFGGAQSKFSGGLRL